MTTIAISDGRPKEPRELRELAAWYRAFAEGAGNPVIWEARLRTAAELEREADRLEEEFLRPARGEPENSADPRENSRKNFSDPGKSLESWSKIATNPIVSGAARVCESGNSGKP